MAQEALPWEEFQTSAPPRGVEIGPDPAKAAAEARAQAAERRAQGAEARAEASAAREAAKFEQETTGGGKPTEAQQKTLTLLTRIAGGAKDIQNVLATDKGAQAPGVGETLARNVVGEGLITRNIAGADRRIVTDAQRDMLDALLTLGTGAAYNKEQLEGQTLSYFPQYGDTPAEIRVKNDRLTRLIEAARIASGPMAAKFDESIAPLLGQIAPPSSDVRQGMEIGAGATYSTDEDIAQAQKLQDAWRSGATVEQMQGLLRPGESFKPEDIQRMQADTGRSMSFIPAQSGTRGEIGQALGAIGESPVGSYTVGAANALTGGFMDELAPIIGLSSQQVQAAKEYLRKKNPVSSFAGEVTGGALAMAPALKGAQALGLGARAPLAADIAYGAGYGAGESNENRLLGGLTGGVVSGATGALARRFLPGGGTPQGVARDEFGGFTPDNIPPAQGVPGEAGAVRSTAPVAAPTPSAAQQAAPTPQQAMQEVGTLISQAAKSGRKADVARQQLAEMANINPDAMAAAERLGIEVPPDVFADNPQIREAIGLTRAVAGSEPSAAWREAVSGAVDQADNVIRQFDTQFVEGAVAPGAAAQRVKDSLLSTRASLNRQASEIYKQVDEAIPKGTPIQMDNLFRELTAIASEVGEQGMAPAERGLLKLIQSGDVSGGDITYGRLIREKGLIGKALQGKESPFGSMDEATLKRLYAALSEDQMDNVGRIGGEEMRKQLRGANLIYAKERALGKRIVNAFGQDLEGSIANRMRSAISGATKGDTGDFQRLMKTVPDDLKKEVVATALASATRSARGAERGGFGFSEFADIYPKLRANPQIYSQIVKTLGPQSDAVLRDLFVVSKRITEARANVPTTGKANQALIMGLDKGQSLANKIMGNTMAQRAASGAVGMVPGGGLFAPDLVQFMAARPDVQKAAGQVFSSPEFSQLLKDAGARGEPSERAVNQVANSPAFRRYAKAANLPRAVKDRTNWIRSAMTAGAVGNVPNEPERPANAISTEVAR